MISDLCTHVPEMCLFQAGFIAVATLMACLSLAFRDYVTFQLDLAGIPSFDPLRWKNSALCYMSSFACLNLVLLTVCNEDINNTIHSTAAVIFFLFYGFYMILCLVYFRAVVNRNTGQSVQLMTKKSFDLKRAVVLAYFTAVITLAILSGHWGPNRVKIAVCEWAAVLLILVWNYTFTHEFYGSYVGVVQVVAQIESREDTSFVAQGFEPMSAYKNSPVYA